MNTQTILFILDVIVKYGPSIFKLLLDAYDWVEDKMRDHKSDEKAKAFNKKLKEDFAISEGINEAREDIWKVKNPDKTPTPLEDETLIYY